MIKHRYETYGAQFIVTIQAQTPETLAKTVNVYCNHGMFLPAAIPAEYDETRHTSVTVHVTKEKLMPSLVAIAEARLIASQMAMPREQRLKGADFSAMAQMEADEVFATFEKVAAPIAADESGVSADLRDYTLTAADRALLSGSRKGARSLLLGAFASARRDSATGAARTESE